MSIDPRELLDQARRLVAGAAAVRPTQADLRRAVSAAYYAMFHHLIDGFTGQLGLGPDALALLTRNFQHEDMATVSKYFCKKATPPKGIDSLLAAVGSDLALAAAAYVDLKEARHTADYDRAAAVTPAWAINLINRAEQAIDYITSTINTPETQFYLACLLLPPDKFKPR